MTIRFYDIEIEDMREATQEDWDLRHQRLVQLTNEIVMLRNRLILSEARQGVAQGTLQQSANAQQQGFTVTPAESNTPR